MKDRSGRIDSPTAWNAISLGPFYEISDNLTVARAHYEEDLRAEEKDHGQNHPHVAITLNSLGRVLKAQGNVNGAYLHFQRALEIDEAVLRPGPSQSRAAGEHPWRHASRSGWPGRCSISLQAGASDRGILLRARTPQCGSPPEQPRQDRKGAGRNCGGTRTLREGTQKSQKPCRRGASLRRDGAKAA